MAKKNIEIPRDNNIIDVSIDEAMPENYLPYAVEVSKDRALPDVRDGLKPVHRRILYGAYMLKAFPDKPYYKSARIVGDILGKYHPHGDSSVYDAMVILAQNFATRMPLIDGHGNWGSIDGDNAAAMRYTEARLSNISMEMLRDIEKEVVDMDLNYSDTEKEPVVLPARYPNLLVNGSFGIAVGLATNIPPHNLGEVIDGTVAYIDNNEITTKELMNYVKGPDLPTGGILIGKNALLAAYETGEGKVTLRAKTNIEKLESGKWAIVISEFPFRKNKAKILQSISDMTGDKKHGKALDSIVDIRDESDRNGIRAVIEFKKNVEKDTVDKVLKYLFKKTELQCNISFNMVALANGKPETLGLKPMLKYYVEHQKDVVTRRTKRELEIAEKRFHIVEGFIKAINILDEVIKTIRSSKSKKDASINLISKFQFTEIQAQAILELMLYRLTGLEIKVFEKEYKELQVLMRKLRKILENEKELFKVIKKELLEVKEKYDDGRRTEIIENDDVAKIELEEIIIEEDVVVTLSNEGFIKRIPMKSFIRTSQNVNDIDYREGDYNKFLINSNTKDTLIMFTSKGNMYQLKAIMIPEFKWKEKGERIESIIKSLDLTDDKIVSVFSIENFENPRDILLMTNKGMLKKTEISKFNTNYSKIVALKLRKDEELLKAYLVNKDREEQFIKIKTKNNLMFTVEEPKIEEGDRNILGKILFNLPSGDFINEVEFTNEYEFKEFFLSLTNKNTLRVTERKTKEKQVILTNSTEEILLFSEKGNIYKIKSYILQNIDKKQIDLKDIIDDYDTEDKIVSIESINENNIENKSFYLATENGMIKRTLASEFIGDYSVNIAYKLKGDDKVISVILVNDNEDKDSIIITKKGMLIRFLLQSINPVGKNAGGVTAISLRDEDKVVYFDYITNETDSCKEDGSLCVDKIESKFIVKTILEDSITVDLLELISQNRGGKGKHILNKIDDEVVSIERE